MIDSEINSCFEYAIKNEEILQLKKEHGMLKVLVKSLEQRKDMLIQLGTMRRQEMMLTDFKVGVVPRKDTSAKN